MYTGDGDYKKYLPPSTSNSIRVDPVDHKEVTLIIDMFNPKKAYGPTSIPSYVLYFMKNELAGPLAVLPILVYPQEFTQTNSKLQK